MVMATDTTPNECRCAPGVIAQEALLLICDTLQKRKVTAVAHSQAHLERVASYIETFNDKAGL